MGNNPPTGIFYFRLTIPLPSSLPGQKRIVNLIWLPAWAILFYTDMGIRKVIFAWRYTENSTPIKLPIFNKMAYLVALGRF